MFNALHSLWATVSAVPHMGRFVATAYGVYLLWLSCYIVLQKREPAATLSWILLLAALPYVGLVVYYVFGPQKIKRHRLRRGRSRKNVEAWNRVCPANAPCSGLARIGQTATGLPASSATSVDWLVDGAATYAAILAAIAGARRHVNLEYYILEPDHTGTALRDALIERARAGVKVRLLLDAVGSAHVGRDFLRPLLEAGVEMAWFHPQQLLKPFKRPWLNLRTHRKLVVVDGAVAFTGGINITDEENDSRNPNAYRDLHMRITGDVVRSLQLVFVEDWIYASGQRMAYFDREDLFPSSTPSREDGAIHAQALVSGPDSTWEAIHRMYVAAIHEARRRVWLVTPYFVPGEAARMALTSAALGGLDTRLLIPRRSDSLFVTLAGRSYFDELLRAGVKIYEYGPRMLHTKAFIADEDTCIVGSANFDHRSFRLNFELSMLYRDRALTSALEAILQPEFASAAQVMPQHKRPLWRQRLPEAFARLASPLL